MAFVQLMPQATISTPRAIPPLTSPSNQPGVSGAVTIPAGTQTVTFRLTSNNWPTGSNDFLLYGLDISRDNGATWTVLAAPDQIDEGARGKDGSMPRISWNVAAQFPPIIEAVLLRARYAVPNGTVRIGLEWELV